MNTDQVVLPLSLEGWYIKCWYKCRQGIICSGTWRLLISFAMSGDGRLMDEAEKNVIKHACLDTSHYLVTVAM